MSELSLVDKGLKDLPRDMAELYAATATTVNLSENNITDPANLSYFKKCETLILDKNGLEDLERFPAMPSVTTLWFNNNNMSDIVTFMDQVTSLYPNLAYLSCMRNPAAPPLVLMGEEDLAQSKRYRLYVIYRIPKLQFLDSSPVTAEERTEAAATGQFMAVRKPKRATAAPASTAADAPALFFGGAPSSSPPASEASDRKPGAFLAVGPTYYDGRHSEGNRFIVDRDL